jgi:hypothetical protein
MDGVYMTPTQRKQRKERIEALPDFLLRADGIILGFDLWIMDEGTAYPPLATMGDPCSPDFGKPIPGIVKNLSSIIKAGTRIYLKPLECRCQCPKTENSGRKKKKRY